MIGRQKSHQKLLQGKFKVNIGDHLEFGDKVAAYSNEKLSFHLYKNATMLRQLNHSPLLK